MIDDMIGTYCLVRMTSGAVARGVHYVVLPDARRIWDGAASLSETRLFDGPALLEEPDKDGTDGPRARRTG